MRPLELTIRGFTCFRDSLTLDFRNLDVFVIHGPTGAGKSTLIDALCYALYGRVPRDTPVNRLVAHDRDEMRVDLTFQAGGERWRVSRGQTVREVKRRNGERERQASPAPIQLERAIGDDWEPVGDRSADVNAILERVVGLDYDTFTRCVLLPQGSFDEFLRGDRQKRREILVELLGTGVYGRMATRAGERNRDLENEARIHERDLAGPLADATAERAAELEAQLAAAGETMAVARTHADRLDGLLPLLAAVDRAAAMHVALQQELAAAEAAVGQRMAEAASRAASLAAARQARDAAAAALNDLGYDSEHHRAVQTAAERRTAWSRAVQTVADCEARLPSAGAIEAAGGALEAARTARERAAELAAAARAASELARQADLVAAVQEHVHAGDDCPVCGSTVVQLAAVDGSSLEAARRGADAAQVTLSSAEQAVVTAERAADRLRTQRQQAEDELERLVVARDDALESLTAAVPAGIAIDVAAIDAALQAAQAAEREQRRLDGELHAARSALLTAEMAERDDALVLAGLQREVEIQQKRAQEADRSLAVAAELAGAAVTAVDQPALQVAASDARTAVATRLARQAREAADTALRDESERRTRLAHLQRDIGTALAKRAERDAAIAGRDLYRDLALLLRADAFQDWVLEAGVQAIAAGASELLRDMHGRFQLTADGTDFRIIDAWQAGSQRAASTLSGGETFIVSLALALALAEQLPLLRQAVSVPLDSLFLDEGFGTLDPETLSTVIDAIEALRERDRLVGIITHVEGLWQRIPARVEVVGTPAGSYITTVGF